MATRSSIAKEAASRAKPEGITHGYDVRSDRLQGLLLRVQPSGRRTFYVQVGRGKRVRLGPADVLTLAQAEERAKAVLLDPSSATVKTRSGITLEEYVNEHYKADAEAKTKTGAATVKRVLAQWPTLVDRRMDDITAADVDKLRIKRVQEGIAPATINRDVYALAGVLTHWAAATGAQHPLARKLKPLRIPKDEAVRYLSPAEEKRLRKALAARDKRMAKLGDAEGGWRAAPAFSTMVLLTANTGLRWSELATLTWERVDLQLKTLSIAAAYSKSNESRVIPLNDEAMKLLRAIKPVKAEGLMFPSPSTGERFVSPPRKQWDQVCKEAELEGFTWHSLRHHFASRLVQQGVALYTVQKLMGHQTAAMTQRYARLAPDTLADAVAKLGTTKR